MQHYILSILLIPFIFFNAVIIKKDIKDKIIPNKFLLYIILLFPLFIIYEIYFYDITINYLSLFYQILLSIIITFLLYYHWIWGAWDAKYLLVLSLFSYHIWIIKFIWNIAIILLIYLLFYFVYFYLWKCLISYSYAKELYKNIYIDLKDKFTTFIKSPDWSVEKNTTIRIILNWTLIFLFIFISFRLLRLFMFSSFVDSPWKLKSISLIYQNYFFHIMALAFLIIFILRVIFGKIYKYIYHLLEDKYWIIFKYDKTKLRIPTILIIILLIFIIYEYIVNPYEIWKYLYRIFTFYIYMYLFIRILFYSYKLSFQISETYYINLEDLKEWEIVDKNFLIKTFWEQKCLWLNNNDWILFPNPMKYFVNINNPIDKDTLNMIKNVYNTVNSYHTENTKNYVPINSIKILKSFSFAPHIFLWFILTIFFQDSIFKYVNNWFIDFIRSLYNIWN